MEKYFIKDSHEEIEFGDIIGLSYEKDHLCGKEKAYMEFEFIPELLDMLLDDGVVEVVKEEPKKEEKKDAVLAVMEEMTRLRDILEDVAKRVGHLEEAVAEKKKIVTKVSSKKTEK